MAIRTALLTSRNINLDTDFSKYIETVSEPGVITGFEVSASAVGTGQAWVPCTRTNNETIYAFVQNFNSVSISGDGYVIISIPQEIVDNGGGNEDGTGIATVEVVDTLPSKNYLLLASISSGVVTDERNIIPTVGELKTDVTSLFASVADLDERVDKLESADAIDHLEERALVGEKYALTDTLFKQLTPKLSDCTVDANVGDVAANTEIHIQRQGSGTASNELKLKMKTAGSPTTSVVVEVRKGILVDVSDSEAYWYGDANNILATGTLASSSFSSTYAEVTFTLDNAVGGTEGELLDIVVYQTTGSGATVNASNYYVLACDSTQWSEGFSYVKVNGDTRSREKLMPYCVSNGFAQALLVKVDNNTISYNYNETINVPNDTTQASGGEKSYKIFTNNYGASTSINYSFAVSHPYSSNNFNATLYINSTQLYSGNYRYIVNTYTGTLNLDNQADLIIKTVLTNSGTFYCEYVNIVLNTSGTAIMNKAYNNKKAIPKDVKEIGEKETAYLFGMLPNGEWRDGN